MMTTMFGAKYEDTSSIYGSDGKFQITIDATKEGINPLFVFDLFFILPLLCAWIVFGVLSCYNLYLFLFR